MLKPTSLLRIFEILWIIAAIIAFGLGLKHLITGETDGQSYYYLFFIGIMGLIMAFIKRKSRLWIQKKEEELARQNNTGSDQ